MRSAKRISLIAELPLKRFPLLLPASIDRTRIGGPPGGCQIRRGEAMETDEIRQQRIDLAAAFRWAARLGFHEGVCNHFSVAVSPSGDRFLVNPHGRHFSEIRASDLLLVEPDGSVAGDGEPPEPTAFFIHSRLHRGIPHARCILHTHMPYATALTTLEGGRLEPVNQNALRFYDQVAYDDDYNGLALDEAEGDRMCAALGNRQIMFMAN